MEHFIYNLYPAIAAAINRGDDYIALLAQEAVEPLVQSVVAILAASIPTQTMTFEDIASIATELALPAANHIKAFATSAFVKHLQDAAQLTGILQVLHWVFHHIHNANRALSNWVWKGNQTPTPKQGRKRAREPRRTDETYPSQKQTISRKDLEMGKTSYMDPHSSQRRPAVDIIGEPGSIIQLRSPEEMLEFDKKGNPWDNWPEEIIVIDDFYDDKLSVLAASDRWLPKSGPILLIIVELCLAYSVYLLFSRRSKLARRQKKIDSAASNSSSTPSNMIRNEGASPAKRDSTVSAPGFLSQGQNHSGNRTSHAATNGSSVFQADPSAGPLLIPLACPQSRRRGSSCTSLSASPSSSAPFSMSAPFADSKIMQH